MNQTNPTAAVTVTAQTISALVSGQPDLKNKFGPGHIRPDGVRLSYRGQHIDARVDGRWVRETGELTTERLDQHYTVRAADDILGWPDWLCALATLLRPAAAPPVASPPTDRAAAPTGWIDGHPQLEAIAAAVWEHCQTEGTMSLIVDDPRNIAVAALAAVLPEQADRAAVLSDVERQFLTYALDLAGDQMASRGDEFGAEDRAAMEALRRLAVEAHDTGTQQQGLRGLLEHVGIDTTGRDITVDGRVVDAGAQQQPERCPHGCDVTRCPCLACEADDTEAGPDRCSGCRYVPCGNCTAPAAQQPAAEAWDVPDARPGTTDYARQQQAAAADGEETPFLTRVLELFSLSHADLYDGALFWRVDDGHVHLFANVSDVFAWGGADCEPITPDTLPALEQAYADLKAIDADLYLPELYTARQRGERPQGAAYPDEKSENWRQVSALFDACGPERPLGLGNPKAAPAHKEPRP